MYYIHICHFLGINSSLHLQNLLQDLENENKIPHEQVSIDEILEMQREEQLAKQAAEDKKKKALVERGLIPQTDPIQEEY